MRRSRSRGGADPRARSLPPLLVLTLVVLTGCSVDNATGASGPTSTQAASPGGEAAPTPTAADQALPATGTGGSDPPRTTESESVPEGDGSTTETRVSETARESEAPLPTPADQPEPALSEEEIRETYGTGAPEPAESMVGTLCNLNRPHLEELSARVVVDGKLDDQTLRLAALSLSDDLGVWEGMAWQVPGVEDEIEVAREIYAHWEYAVGLVDAGDQETAMDEWDAAAELVGALPTGDVSEVGC